MCIRDRVTTAIRPVDTYNGSCLSLVIDSPVAPPVLNTLRLICMGTPLPLATDNGFCACLLYTSRCV